MTIPAAKSAKPAASAIPYFIIGAFVLFAIYIGLMVQQAMRTSVELVSADYYQQELGYQQRIDAKAHAAALLAPVQINTDATTHALTIQLPAALTGQTIEGSVHFVRPSDALLDFTVPFRPDVAGRQVLTTAALHTGHWLVRLDFKAAGQSYFIEEVLER